MVQILSFPKGFYIQKSQLEVKKGCIPAMKWQKSTKCIYCTSLKPHDNHIIKNLPDEVGPAKRWCSQCNGTQSIFILSRLLPQSWLMKMAKVMIRLIIILVGQNRSNQLTCFIFLFIYLLCDN